VPGVTKGCIPIEFRVLGPLEVVEDGRVIRLDRQRMRALLAFLLLHPNEPVSADRLIDQVWGPEPPKTAGASLQNYVSRLRKAIGAELIVSRPPGYALKVDPEHFDLARFERLTGDARGAPPAERAAKLRAALALWRGSALEDLAFEPFVRDEAGRLDETRLAALEQRIDADLSLGLGDELVGELEELVEEHPLRERLHAQLMLALYRGGRQADALAAYGDARRVLLDELGLEPSEELRDLQRRILEQDASLRTSPGIAEQVPDRRTVTVLFCDIVDSTRLATELDPEVYRRLLSRYFELVKEAISRHGGTVEKFIGDAVMAIFGVPDLHEDDALRAVRAAVVTQAAIRAQGWEMPLVARIGVSTGEVHVLSAPGEDLHVSGAAASVASQLEGRAPAGGILLEESTYRLVRDAVDACKTEGGWLLENLVAGAPAYARRLDAPIVGREEELKRVLDAYDNACETGRCRVVTLVGEAGIGKTRVMRELLARVGEPVRAFVGRCVSYGEGATYLPVAEIVRQASPDATIGAIAALLGDAADGELVARRVAELTGLSEGASAPGEVFWAVRRFLESLASTGPIVVVIDDIHWAEPTLLDLLEYLGEWSEGPMLVLCAARRELLETRPSWGGPTSTGFLVELSALPPEQITDLVSGLAGQTIDPQVEARIVEHAGGNPLFAEQLVALAEETPAMSLDDPPATVEALLASRLDGLEPSLLSVLRRASVIGRRFSTRELQDLSPVVDAPTTTRHLSELTERAFVHPTGDLYRFHHVLVRDVAYRGLPKSERAGLHELAARGLDRRDGADEIVGFHFEQAYRYVTELGTVDGKASVLAREGGERLGRAGIRAWKRADVPAAVNLLSRAVDLSPEATELICELGLAHRNRGDLERARASFSLALDHATAAGDRGAELRARIELGLLKSVSEPGVADELLDVAAGAIPALEALGDDRTLGRAWIAVGHVRGGFRCEYGALEEAAARAAQHYGRAGWSPAMSMGDFGLALFFGPQHAARGVAQCQDLLRSHADDRATTANILMWLGGLEAMQRKFEQARVHVDDAVQIHRELGHVTDATDRVLGAIEMLAGMPVDAEAAYRRSCDALEQAELTSVLATRAAELADVLCELGRYDEADEWIRVSRRHAGADDRDANFAWRYALARLATRVRREDAEEIALEALALISPTDALNRRADIHLVLSEVAGTVGRLSKIDHAHAALELYEQKGNAASADRARDLFPDLSRK
jgi:DNA-binding SARP family transcriptional activator/tetratricopeptide (TPR) repeat protein